MISPNPMRRFLHIYNNAWKDCYPNYLEGAKLLHKFLAPVQIPKNIPDYTGTLLTRNYELNELAKVMSGKGYGPMNKHILNALIYTEIERCRDDY